MFESFICLACTHPSPYVSIDSSTKSSLPFLQQPRSLTSNFPLAPDKTFCETDTRNKIKLQIKNFTVKVILKRRKKTGCFRFKNGNIKVWYYHSIKFVFTFGYTTTDNFSLLMLHKSQMRHHRYIMKGI